MSVESFASPYEDIPLLDVLNQNMIGERSESWAGNHGRGTMSEIRRGEVLIGGFVNSYLDAGEIGAPTVLCLHGAGFGSEAVTCWPDLMSELSVDYRLLALDFYGHGESAKLAALDRSSRRLHEIQVIEFCRALDIEPVAIVGSSHGGSVAFFVAVSGELPPFKVVSIAGTGGYFHRHGGFDAMNNHRPDLDWATEMASLGKSDPTAEDVALRLERSLLPGHIEALQASHLRNASPGERPSLDELCKTIDESGMDLFFIAGRDDPLLDSEWIEEFARRLPGAKTLVVGGARHEPQRNQPALVARAIRDFLGS